LTKPAKIFNVRQFTSFSLIGVSNTAIHYFVFLFLFDLLGVHYLVSSFFGYIFGMVNSYILNSYITFKQASILSRFRMIKFLLVNLLALLINLLAMKLLVDTLLLRAEFSQIIAILIALFFNFILNKVWTFA